VNEINLNTVSSGPKRVRLTREELLAGKCFPDEQKISLDPRLKSAEDFLLKRAQPASAAQTTIAALIKSHELEMQAWREYEAKVLEWKTTVTEKLEQFKIAANSDKAALIQQLEQAQQKIQELEQELTWFRQQLTAATSTTF
jgi:hypothetical protein